MNRGAKCPKCGEWTNCMRDVYSRFGTIHIVQYYCEPCSHMWDHERRVLRHNHVIKDHIFKEALAMTLREEHEPAILRKCGGRIPD